MNDIRIVKALQRIQEEFEELSKLPGPQGETGPQGPQGERGEPGKDGRNGLNGADGRDGAPGRDGKDGKNGKNGKDGLNGRDGKDGLDGKNGKNGTNGKDGVGIKKIELLHGRLIITLTNGKRIDLGVIPQGPPGLPGMNGISVVDVEIQIISGHRHLICTMSDGTTIDAGIIPSGGGGSYSAGTGIDIDAYDVISVVTSDLSYNDLQDKPTIPENTSDLNNDSGFITSSDIPPIPSKTSDLQNDSGFVTSADVPTKTSDLQNDSGFITSSDVPTKTSDLQNDSGFITSNDIPPIPSKTSDLQNDSGFITASDIPAIPTKTSDLQNDSGFIDNTYHDSTKADVSHTHTKSEITDFPTNVSAFNNDAGYLTAHQDISGKYDKTGGNISGDVDIDGTFKFNIDDPDYVVDITATPRIDINRGTIINLTGHASGTPYKTVLENIGTPVNNFDAANKKYVDELCAITWITGIKDSQGITISSDAYQKCYDAITQNNSCYLKLTQSGEVAVLRLKAWLDFNDHSTHGDSFLFVDAVDTLNTRQVVVDYNGATYSESELETTANKVTTFTGSSTDTQYPSAKLCEDMFSYIGGNYQRKPDIVWQETTPANYLKGIQADLSASPAWQLTDLDLTPYKRIKVYSCAGKGSTNISTTPAIVLEMSLDPRAASSAWGGNYCGSVIIQKSNDANRLATLTCAVSADKTKFVVLRQSSIYGTAATSNNDIGADVFMIEGYYD